MKRSMTRISIAVLAFSLSVIAALAFVYFPRLLDRCTQIDWTDQEQVRLCEEMLAAEIPLRSLSEIYPLAYWMAYVGVAASLSALFYRTWTKKGVGKIMMVMRLILINIVIWYVMLPFTYSWDDFHTEWQVFIPQVAGFFAGFPLSYLVFVAAGPILELVESAFSSFLTDGLGFGPDNLILIFLHLMFVLTAYMQWLYLVPAAWRRWRKKKLAPATRE